MLARTIGMHPLWFAQANLAQNLTPTWLLYPVMACLMDFLAMTMVTFLRLLNPDPEKDRPVW